MGLMLLKFRLIQCAHWVYTCIYVCVFAVADVTISDARKALVGALYEV